MKKLNKIIAAILVTTSFNSFAQECAALSGEYTIGKSEESSFSTFTEAFNALKCGGVEAPVSFLIDSGTYNERATLSGISGASALNPITFASRSGRSADVVISYNTSDATLVMVNASFVSFENITVDHKAATYGNCMRVDGDASNLHFKGVVFNGVELPRAGAVNATVYFTSVSPKSDIAFDACEINNGSIGICKGGENSSSTDSKTSITGTTFTNQQEAGMVLANEVAPVVTSNIVNTVSTNKDFTAISLTNVSDKVMVNKNVVNAANCATGIMLNDCVAQDAHPGQIMNNSVNISGSRNAYGIRVSGSTCYQVIDFNSIKLKVNKADASTQAFYMNSSSGKEVNMTNSTLYDLTAGKYMVYGDMYKSYSASAAAPALSASAK